MSSPQTELEIAGSTLQVEACQIPFISYMPREVVCLVVIMVGVALSLFVVSIIFKGVGSAFIIVV